MRAGRTTKTRSSFRARRMPPAGPGSRSLANATELWSSTRPSGRQNPVARSRRQARCLTVRESPPLTQLRLSAPAQWTITVVGPEDRPVAGLRLAPHSVRRTDRRIAPAPTVLDPALAQSLTVTTNAAGLATLSSLPESMVPLSVRVASASVTAHTLPLDVSQRKNAVLKLGGSGRMVGVVRTTAGVPLVDVPVELWVRGSGTLPGDLQLPGDGRITRNELVVLDPHSLRSGPAGAFQTPRTLLVGLQYRISIRQDGFMPFVSDWVTLDGERATIPSIRLQPLQTFTGQIKDKQGRAVAGARVFLPAGGPVTTSDAQGRLAVNAVSPGKMVILAEHPGFRLRGWLADPEANANANPRTLVRINETPEPAIKPLPDAVPPDESRALANRLLEPYLIGPNDDDDHRPDLAALASLCEFDVELRARPVSEGELSRRRPPGAKHAPIAGHSAL